MKHNQQPEQAGRKRNQKQQPTAPSGTRDTKKQKMDASHPGFNKWFDKKLFLDPKKLRKALLQADSLPHFNDTDSPPCLNFHLLGDCKCGEKCARAQTHAKPSADFEKVLSGWRTQAIA